jgi:N-acetylglutamate synthase-like GNAT family acetyltransferase
MDIKLIKAKIEDSNKIHQMQLKSFKSLLEKYEDYDTNPGNEDIEKTIQRLNETITDYYIIKLNEESIGGIRVLRLEEGNLCKVGPLFILPEYQNKGFGQKTFKMIEKKI